MQIHLHQTHHTIADFKGILEHIKNYFTTNQLPGLHLYPELFLCGYPLQDLCLQREFIEKYQSLLHDLDQWSLNSFSQENTHLLLGGLEYDFDPQGLPLHIKNVIYLLSPGQKLKTVYVKQLLPNYDIFDEKKYFTPGTVPAILELNGQKVALLICEDMWPTSSYPVDPVAELQKCNQPIDLIVNLSASPFHLGKHEKRIERAQEISAALQAPFVYLNRVGGEDEILFDGGSFVAAPEKVISQCSFFREEHVSLLIEKQNSTATAKAGQTSINSWESLFQAQLDYSSSIPTLKSHNDYQCELILHAIQFGIQEYASKCGFSNFLVASSGGIDSALVLTIMKLILKKGQTLEAIFMPGFFSASQSFDLSYELAKKLGVRHTTLPIKFFHSAIKNAYRENFGNDLAGLADENIQSRLRGALLYTRSNHQNSMVINTSNKSELAVGYSTLYGDSVGAISMLGDLYKTEIYQLAHFINKKYNHIIPSGIIERPPTAELRENQTDEQSLPPYQRLDAMLEGILSYRMSNSELIKNGFNAQEVEQVYKLYTRSEYKRRQFCPIIKLKAKSFGFGYRVPICKK